MTASHPRKSDRRTSCLSTGHGRARPGIQQPSQIVHQITAFDATRRSTANLLNRLDPNHTPHPRHSNPHSARRTTHVSLPAVSSLGGLRTPAPCPRRHRHGAGIRKPSQRRTIARFKGWRCQRSIGTINVSPVATSDLSPRSFSAKSSAFAKICLRPARTVVPFAIKRWPTAGLRQFIEKCVAVTLPAKWQQRSHTRYPVAPRSFPHEDDRRTG